jgi:integrase
MAEERLPAGLTKRGNTYVVQHLVGGRWKRRRVGTDLAAALEHHARLRAAGSAEPRPKPPRLPSDPSNRSKSPGPVRIGFLIERWLDDQRMRCKPNTVRCSIDRANRLAQALGTSKLVVDLTTADVAKFVEARRRWGAGDVAINAHLRVLRAMLNWAESERLVEEVPVRVRLLRVADKRQITVFTSSEIEELLDNAEPRARVLIMLAAATGARRDELLHLQWCDVDLADGRIEIRPKTFTERRRDRTEVERRWSPKTHEARECFVTDEVVRELRRFRLAAQFSTDADWVFQSTKRRRLRWANPTKALHAAFRDADLYRRGELLHKIRHSVGTALVRSTDLETARAALGHRNMATTAKYLHTDRERRRRAGSSIGLLNMARGMRS